MMMDALDMIVDRGPELLEKLIQHLLLTGGSTIIAVIAGLTIGVLLSRRPVFQGPVMVVINALQTIPSLAMLAFLLPLFGIGTLPALIALTLYALLPIVRNTLTGIDGLSPELLEACEALGFTERQRLIQVELPLALPTIMAGIRTAAVISVGVATLAAFIGAGGLGDFIVRGLAVNNNGLVLLGAVPAAILALTLDRLLYFLEGRLKQKRSHPSTGVAQRRFRSILAVLAVGALIAALLAAWQMAADPRATVRVASKNFTEQYILAEAMAQMLERHTDLRVERKLSLGSVHVVHNALLNQEVDVYPEYTGTAWRAILKKEETLDAQTTFERVQQAYRERFELEWLPPFGYENTYAILVTEALAREHNLRSISDLTAISPELVMGFSAEFYERVDGYSAFRERYSLAFSDTAEMDLGLVYQALQEGRIDVAAGNSTDGRIAAFDLVMLTDDRRFFPPYDAAIVARTEIFEAFPEVAEVLRRLSGSINVDAIREMNRQVDQEQRSAASVALDFLRQEGLLQRPEDSAAAAGDREAIDSE